MTAEEVRQKYMVAIEEGKAQSVELMLERNEKPSKDEWRIVHYAASYANQDTPDKTFMESCHRIILALHKSGCNLNSLDEEGFTPLHIACKYGHHDMASILLTNGAEIELKDRSGKTPLHLASTHQIIQLLLQHNVDVNAKAYDFSTKLHLIASDPSETSFKMLGLLLETRNNSSEQEKWVQVDIQDKKGNTPAHLAAHKMIQYTDKRTSTKYSNAKLILEALLKHDASFEIPDMKKRSLKAYAAEYSDIADVLDKSREQCRVCEVCVVQ